jgi:hypothetical protein
VTQWVPQSAMGARRWTLIFCVLRGAAPRPDSSAGDPLGVHDSGRRAAVVVPAAT